MDDADLDEVTRTELMAGYMRRRMWEARVLAAALVAPLGGGLGLPSGGGRDVVVGRSGRRYEAVAPSEFLRRVGGG